MTPDEIKALAVRCERQGGMKTGDLDRRVLVLHLQETLRLAGKALQQFAVQAVE